MTACVVIPVFNEERQLAASVERVCAAMRSVWLDEFTLVVADNGSTDGTARIARSLAARLAPVQMLRLDRPGRGGALRAAWQQAEAEVLAYMDVDLSTDLRDLGTLLSAVAGGDCDLAVGSRLLPDSVVTRGWRREMLSRVYNRLLQVALGLRCRDAQCGFKAISRSAAARVLPGVVNDRWFFDTELLVLAEAQGLRVREIPVRWKDDPDSRVRILATICEDLRGIVRVRRQLGKARAGLRRTPVRG